MKKQLFTILIALIAMVEIGNAQDLGVKLYGYARGEFAVDTRQVYAAREGNYMTVPKEVLKVDGKDVNATANFTGWGIESRLGVKAVGPSFFGFASTAVVEGHFFGAGGGPNSFSLRHAFVQLDNEALEIKVGQFWHPFFVTNVSPGTYNFNAGHPFQPFNRSPQIRVTTKGDGFKFIGALLTELDFRSAGGSQINSGMPTLHAQVQFGSDDSFVGGVGANYKTIRPALGADNVGALSFGAYAKANLGAATWKIHGNYGQNMTEQLMFGGTATKKGSTDVLNNNQLSLWTEFSGDMSEKAEWGLFAGYTSDLGFSEAVEGYGSSVVNAFRVAPRVGWKEGNTKFTLGLDYTSATYGGLDTDGKKMVKAAQDATVGNIRLSTSVIQSF